MFNTMRLMGRIKHDVMFQRVRQVVVQVGHQKTSVWSSSSGYVTGEKSPIYNGLLAAVIYYCHFSSGGRNVSTAAISLSALFVNGITQNFMVRFS